MIPMQTRSRKRWPSRLLSLALAMAMILSTLLTQIPVLAAESLPLGGWTSPHNNFQEENGKVTLTSTGDNNFVVSDTRVTAFTMEADMTMVSGDAAGLMFAVEDKENPGSSWGALHVEASRVRAFHVPNLDKLDTAVSIDPSVQQQKVHIKVSMDAAGNLRVFLNNSDTPTLSAQYDGYTGGYLGLCSWKGDAVFENITYTEEAQIGFSTNISGWYAAGGDWAITDSGYRANNPAMGNTYAYSDEVIPTGKNFVLEGKLHIEVPEGGGGAGIAIVPNTANPNETWYCANIDKMYGNTTRLFKNRYPGGDFWSVGRNLTAEETAAKDYTLRIEYTDGVFRYYLNDILVDSYSKDTFTGGVVSLMTFNSDTTFQNVNITYGGPSVTGEALTGWSGGSFQGGEGTEPVYVENTGGNNFVMSTTQGKYFTMEADVTLEEGCEAAGFLFGVPNRDNPGADWCALQINNYHENGKARVFNVPNLDLLDSDGILEPGTRDKPIHLKLTVSPGNIIRVYVNDAATPVVETTYENYAGGYLGLCSYNGAATFENVTFQESQEPNFNTNLTGFKDEGTWSITNKGYRGDNDDNGGNVFSFSDVVIPEGASFILEGDLHIDNPKGGAGLVIAQNPANPYETWICANIDKYYGSTTRLFKNNGADVWGISGGLTSAQIAAQDYHLRIECINNAFSYYLDGVLIGTWNDPDFNGGTIGVMTFGSDTTFDNLYYYLAEDIPQLTSLEVIGATLDQPFDPATTAYTATVENTVSSIRIKAEAKDRFELKLNNSVIHSGVESADIPLRVGKNTLKLVVSDDETKLSLPIDITIYREVDEETIYEGDYRPQFHFTPQTMWMNDPNGLTYNAATGEYHMYYQYNPESLDWGTPHWGHAVSKDLIHWTDYGIVLSGNICSGGGVIDYNNCSGLFDESVPPEARMVFFYNGLRVAYSTDGGYTLNKVDTPDVPGSFDPKVVWYEDAAMENGGVWLAITGGQGTDCKLYTSNDLLHWTYNSSALDKDGNTMETECPDIYPLALDGDNGNIKWVINAGGVFYVVGNVTKDDSGILHFRAETDKLIFNGDSRGASATVTGQNYATSTYFNDAKDRRISVSWLIDSSAASLGTEKCWNGAQSLPLETQLKTVDGQMRLITYPVEEVDTLRSGILYETENNSVAPDSPNILEGVTGIYYDIEGEFTLDDNVTEFGFVLRKGNGQQTVVKYDVENGQMVVDKSQGGPATGGICPIAMAPMENGKVKLRILVDTSVIEAFGNDGQAAVSTLFFPDASSDGMEFYTLGGNVTIDSLTIYSMNSAWEEPVPEPVPTELSGLELSNGTLDPAFDKDTLNYTATVANSVSSVKVMPTYTGDTAVTVNGKDVASGSYSEDIALEVGPNAITVAAGDKTYTITVTREEEEQPPVGEKPLLDGLELSEGTLTPAFDKDTFSYTAAVGNEVEGVQVKAFFADGITAMLGEEALESGVYSEEIPLQVGENEIVVTLSLEGEESEYVIVVTREEEAVTEPEPTPGTDKPSIPGSDEDQAGGGDWDWPSGSGNDSANGSGSGEKENPASGDSSMVAGALAVLALSAGAAVILSRKRK